jgi:hypothetical protein
MPEVADVQHDETAEREEREQSALGAGEPGPTPDSAARLGQVDAEESAPLDQAEMGASHAAPLAEERWEARHPVASIGRDRWVRETVTLGLTGETYRLESRIARPRRFGRLPLWASALILAFVVMLSTLACVAVLQAERFGRDLLQPPAATAPAGTPHTTPSVPKK